MAEKEREAPSFWIPFFGFVEVLLDKFGWPGALLIYGIYFVETNATKDQRQAMIDMYVLGRGIDLYYPLFIMGVVVILAFFGQSHYYQRKMKADKAELKRLGLWKTAHQEKQVAVPLHHIGEAEEK